MAAEWFVKIAILILGVFTLHASADLEIQEGKRVA